MNAEHYTDAEFAEIVELRKKWLNSYSDAEKRLELAYAIDEIEYKDYSEEQRRRIRNRKQQMANYVKVRMACPSLKVSIDDFITEENIAIKGPPKILFGVMELANVAATLCKEFRNQKVEAYCIDFFKHPFKYSSDLSRQRNKFYQEKLSMLGFVSEVISEFDVFNVFFCHTLLYNIDMTVYRELDKKVVVHYSGGEIRLYPLAARKSCYLTLAEDTIYADFQKSDNNILVVMLLLSNYAHASLAYNNEFVGQLKLAYTEYFEIPQPLVLSDFEGFGCDKEEAAKFTIVHAATNADIKGSRYVQDAVDALKRNYEFDYVSLSRVPHEKAKAAYAKADLIIDQLIIGWHGILSLEVMAMGKPVICYLCGEFFEQAHVKDIPIINADINNLKDKIEWALNNRDRLKELGKKGLEYVKANHDSKKIAMRYLEVYEQIPFQKPSPIKLIKRQDFQSMNDIKAGLLYLSSMRKNFGEFFAMNGHKRIGLYGSYEMLAQVKSLLNPVEGISVDVGEFLPNGVQIGFDAIILMMETDINKSYVLAQKKCPQALIITLNELILLTV